MCWVGWGVMSLLNFTNRNKGNFNQSKFRFNFYCCPSECKLIPVRLFCKQNYLTIREVETLSRKGKVYVKRYRNQVFVAWNPAYEP